MRFGFNVRRARLKHLLHIREFVRLCGFRAQCFTFWIIFGGFRFDVPGIRFRFSGFDFDFVFSNTSSISGNSSGCGGFGFNVLRVRFIFLFLDSMLRNFCFRVFGFRVQCFASSKTSSKSENSSTAVEVSGSMSCVVDSIFGVSGSFLGVSGLMFWVSGFDFWISTSISHLRRPLPHPGIRPAGWGWGFRAQFWSSTLGVSCSIFRVSGSISRVSGFKFRVLSSIFRSLGSIFRVSCSAFRDSGFQFWACSRLLENITQIQGFVGLGSGFRLQVKITGYDPLSPTG